MTEEYRGEKMDAAELAVKRIKDLTGGSTYTITEQLIVDAGFLREQVEEGAQVVLKFPDGSERPVQFNPIQPDPESNIIHFPKSPQDFPHDSE